MQPPDRRKAQVEHQVRLCRGRGDTLPVLQKSGIKEVKGFAGFPIGGRFLRAGNPALTASHRAKVYGFPAPGAPPLGALHLDLRFVNGKSWLVFGPYAGWSPKFLKHGQISDLPRSIRPDNLLSVLGVGLTERRLLNYLISQLRLSEPERVSALREFAPSAIDSDWELTIAGQRVQVIRRDERNGGVLEFGTTVIGDADGSIAGLLGGSPGLRPRWRSCWTCCRNALPTAINPGCPRSKKWCRRWGCSCRMNPRCSTRCGHGAPRR